MRAAPTDDELAMLAGYRGDEDDLTKPEQFLLQLSRVSRLHAKLRSLAFSLQFPEACQEVSDALEAIQSAREDVHSTDSPPRVHSVLVHNQRLNRINHPRAYYTSDERLFNRAQMKE